MLQMLYNDQNPAADEKAGSDEAASTPESADKEPPASPEKAVKAIKKPTPEELVQAIRPLLIRYFQPALLARFKVVPFLPLDQSAMQEIVSIKLGQVAQRLQDSHHISMEYSGDLVARITTRCTEIETGARNIDFIIDRAILPDVSRSLLGHLAEEKMPTRLFLELDEKGDFIYRFS
jgi:type VI secretion system protein VasG